MISNLYGYSKVTIKHLIPQQETGYVSQQDFIFTYFFGVELLIFKFSLLSNRLQIKSTALACWEDSIRHSSRSRLLVDDLEILSVD